MSNFDGRAIAIRRFLLYWLVTDSIKAGVNGNRQTVYFCRADLWGFGKMQCVIIWYLSRKTLFAIFCLSVTQDKKFCKQSVVEKYVVSSEVRCDFSN